ncbi:MAG: 50S ribosomal protein L18 [Candidatus Aminicenantales bacterium]
MLKDRTKIKKSRKDRLRKRIAQRIRGTSERPRVHVFKSNLYIYTQVINDKDHAVLAAASSLEKEFQEKSRNTKNKAAAAVLGELLARRLKDRKIERVVFDRGTYLYHGRIKALADAMRKEGIDF